MSINIQTNDRRKRLEEAMKIVKLGVGYLSLIGFAPARPSRRPASVFSPSGCTQESSPTGTNIAYQAGRGL